jgi:hypothetical protein
MGKIHDRFKNKQFSSISQARLTPPPPSPDMTNHHDIDIFDAFRKYKYIVVHHPVLNEVALAFPNFLIHRDMARQVFRGLTVVGAGFYNIEGEGDRVLINTSEAIAASGLDISSSIIRKLARVLGGKINDPPIKDTYRNIGEWMELTLKMLQDPTYRPSSIRVI